jgi:hypothetical protein
MFTSLPRKPVSSSSSSSLIALQACFEASKEQCKKGMKTGASVEGMIICRLTISLAISSALFAMRSCALNNSSKLVRDTGKNKPVGKCRRRSRLIISASFSSTEIFSLIVSAVFQSWISTASKKGCNCFAQSCTLHMCCSIGRIGDGPNILKMLPINFATFGGGRAIITKLKWFWKALRRKFLLLLDINYV